MEKIILVSILIFSLVLISSCNVSLEHFIVADGNYDYSKGEYQNAAMKYLSLPEDTPFPGYIEYNLGNVFYALGESEAAVEEWEKAAATEDAGLLFRVVFNQGVLFFESGLYDKSFHAFKAALELEPSNITVKINLEFVLQKLNGTQQNVRIQIDLTTEKPPGDEVTRILEYIKRKEEWSWQSSEDQQLEPNRNDW